MEAPIYYTPEEIADRWRVHVETVHRWIRARKLAAIDLPSGGKRIPREEVERRERLPVVVPA